jgi:microcystin-dependent protein
MSFFKWSRTAASNSNADSSINWAEGQAPSSVNDSARALMAAAAKYRDDVAGAITTGGTSTAYTLTSYETFDSLANMSGHMVAFVPHATNSATVTLNVDGLGAKPLRSAPSTELGAGVLVQGTPYCATYFNSANEWILQGFYGAPFDVPLAVLLPYAGATAPNSNFVLPYGQAISRTTYASLFTLISTTFGAGDGSTTFNVPDLRGRMLAGKDDMGGSAASRITSGGSGITGTTLGATGGAQNVTLAAADIPPLPVTIPSGQGSHSHGLPSDIVYQAGAVNSPGGSPAQRNIETRSTDAATLPAMTGTANNGVSPAAVNKMPPTIILNYILRVL